MCEKVYIITETDDEYGYDIFVDVSDSPEKALSICTEIYEKTFGKPLKFPLILNKDKTQIVESNNGKPWNTAFFLSEVVVKTRR